jgi:hypothetical protein
MRRLLTIFALAAVAFSGCTSSGASVTPGITRLPLHTANMSAAAQAYLKLTNDTNTKAATIEAAVTAAGSDDTKLDAALNDLFTLYGQFQVGMLGINFGTDLQTDLDGVLTATDAFQTVVKTMKSTPKASWAADQQTQYTTKKAALATATDKLATDLGVTPGGASESGGAPSGSPAAS